MSASTYQSDRRGCLIAVVLFCVTCLIAVPSYIAAMQAKKSRSQLLQPGIEHKVGMNSNISDTMWTILLGMAALVVIVGCTEYARWIGERRRVRRAILHALADWPTSSPDKMLREQVLALIACQGTRLGGLLAAVQSPHRLWLCFLADHLLVVSGKTGTVVTVTFAGIGKIALVESRRRNRLLHTTKEDFLKAWYWRRVRQTEILGIETQGKMSIVHVPHLDDLGRIVNLLMHRGTPLHYLRREDV